MQRNRCTQQLPVAKVASRHNDTLLLRIGSLQIFQALYLYLFVDIAFIQQRKTHHLDHHASKAVQAIFSNLLRPLLAHTQTLADIGLCHLHSPARHDKHRHTSQKACHQLAQP